MIVFYDKRTGDIFGTISGRVHSKEEIDKMAIVPSGISRKYIGKYVVPFKTVYRIGEQPIVETRILDRKTLKIGNVVVGKRKVKVGAGMKPAIKQAKLILDFEDGKKNIYDYKIRVKNGKARFIRK